MIKGISGGRARKCTSIGVELVSDPFWILLDKPTSNQPSRNWMVDLNDKTGNIAIINIIICIILGLSANSYGIIKLLFI